jgi:hypothetical protein
MFFPIFPNDPTSKSGNLTFSDFPKIKIFKRFIFVQKISKQSTIPNHCSAIFYINISSNPFVIKFMAF